MKQLVALLVALGFANPVVAQTAPASPDYVKARQEAACSAARRAEVSARLEAIRASDQGGRARDASTPSTPQSDLDNRKEVATLFAEGCFTTGRDFHNAALVYQHGEVPEHYYQTYVWASHAVQLGDAEARWLIPRAIDRYLMNTGYKQLYATNLINERFFGPVPEGVKVAWCVWPTVTSITDRRRTALGVSTLAQQIDRAKGMNNGTGTGLCAIQVPDPPHGLFPGYWLRKGARIGDPLLRGDQNADRRSARQPFDTRALLAQWARTSRSSTLNESQFFTIFDSQK